MLIPFYDVDPRIAAQLVPNGYVNKLIVEAYQMLYAASWYHFPMARKAPGYFNHPFTVWGQYARGSGRRVSRISPGHKKQGYVAVFVGTAHSPTRMDAQADP